MNAPATSPATSVSITAPTYNVVTSPASLTIAQGSTGSTTITVTPVGSYNGTVTLGCSGLPANSTCTFSPATLSFTGSGQPAGANHDSDDCHECRRNRRRLARARNRRHNGPVLCFAISVAHCLAVGSAEKMASPAVHADTSVQLCGPVTLGLLVW